MINMEPIGTVRSVVTEPTDEGWGEVTAEIVLDERLADGLQGLDAFSHALVVFYMDRSSFQIGDDLVRRPQGRPDMPMIGIFAQRAKHRPNPIGITAVQIVSIDGPVLRVKGLDAIDGTPVLDLKPYFHPFDLVADSTVPEWVPRLMADYF